MLVGKTSATLIVLCLLGSPCWPQSQPAPVDDVEKELIMQVMGLGEPPVASVQERMLEFQAWRYSDPGAENGYALVGFLWLRPYFVQESLCAVPRYAVEGRLNGDDYTWEFQRPIFYWQAESADSCDIKDSSQIPDAVETRESIPTHAIVQIINGSQELLELALSNPNAARFRDSGRAWRLREVSLSRGLAPDIGIAYTATFDADRVRSGPSVSFSLKGEGFEVYDVGEWVY